jgi:hypothetical protein
LGFVVDDGLVCRAEEIVGALRSLASLVELAADWVRGAPVGAVVELFVGGVPQIGHAFAAVETWWPHLLQDTSGMSPHIATMNQSPDRDVKLKTELA